TVKAMLRIATESATFRITSITFVWQTPITSTESALSDTLTRCANYCQSVPLRQMPSDLFLVTPVPVAPVRPIVAIQGPVGRVSEAVAIPEDGSTTIPPPPIPASTPPATISAASHRPLAARRRTVLRHRQRSSTRDECGNDRKGFQRVHHHSPSAYA